MNCEGCGALEYVLIDGYDIGDRLLEGVMFEIRQVNGKYTATTRADSKDYMADLNEKKWLKAMREYAAETDTATCPKCHGEVAMNEEVA
jgi:hypothetical protein